MKITPVLVVESIEKSLPFWVDRMGFEKGTEVPEGDTIGFVILTRGGVELMLQSVDSVRKDAPQFADTPGTASLFIEVDDFDDTRRRLAGYPVALGERTTFYGMKEVGVREPGGNIVIFAARA
jgi:hypothetical protein